MVSAQSFLKFASNQAHTGHIICRSGFILSLTALCHKLNVTLHKNNCVMHVSGLLIETCRQWYRGSQTETAYSTDGRAYPRVQYLLRLT